MPTNSAYYWLSTSITCKAIEYMGEVTDLDVCIRSKNHVNLILIIVCNVV
jgi:hypothetical protein